ncbi:MAG: VOC family protein [Verrucomicrobium sp.]|nr:VOC family protein [Verrucomicrobium sp.]
MKVRTVYFKIADLERASAFWATLLGVAPHKESPAWVEFRVGGLNFGLLRMEGFACAPDAANGVPVFQVAAAERDRLKEKALALGARLVVDLPDHPDGQSCVLADPAGNEFELTSFAGA